MKQRKKKRSKGKLASETFCNRYLIVFIVVDSAQSEVYKLMFAFFRFLSGISSIAIVN